MFGNTTAHLFFAILLFYKESPWVNAPQRATINCKSNSSVTLDKKAQLVAQCLH